MDFNFKLFTWSKQGDEPSDKMKQDGFIGKYKPPAGVFNRFWYLVTNAITELQTKFGNHADSKENPHGVTATQIGLGKVNNTPDSEKSVAFASEAGVGRKVKHAISVRFNGGSTEGTDLWTYDGSTSRSINITPAKIKAADKTHSHTLNDVNETAEKKIQRLVVATSTDGITYTATANGITELYNGLEITIIPNTVSTARNITLNINGLGAVPIRRPLSFSTFVATSIDADRLYFLSANTPCRLMYHANYTSGGIWLMADKQKTSAQDLYGNVPIKNGGTGADTVEGALANLGISHCGQVEAGTYVGTGTYGASNPNTLTFGFTPKAVIIVGYYRSAIWDYGNAILPINESYQDSDGNIVRYSVHATWDENTLTWYCSQGTAYDATFQFNGRNVTYTYIAIA